MGRRPQETTGSSTVEGSSALDASCCVAEVMGTELFTLTPDTVVGSALRLAATKRIHHFLVIEDGSLTGIVCQDDLRLARQGALVGECMSSPVLCIGPETTLKEAADIMQENAVGCLPVVTGAFLVGVITRDKLVRMGVNAEESGETPEVEPQPPVNQTCAACGSTQSVRRDLRTGLLFLCAECAAVMPSTDPPRGN
jgi:CBS domain-containing protein